MRLPTAATVIVRSTRVPDFASRYRGLVTGTPPSGPLAAWQIDFTWFCLPKTWRPLSESDAEAQQVTGRELVFVDGELLARFPCQKLARMRDGDYQIGSRLREVLDILFTSP